MRHDTKQASEASLSPHLRLAHGVVARAAVDMRDGDTIKALDALCFWLSDECRWWLDAVGYPREPERALVQVLVSSQHEQSK